MLGDQTLLHATDVGDDDVVFIHDFPAVEEISP